MCARASGTLCSPVQEIPTAGFQRRHESSTRPGRGRGFDPERFYVDLLDGNRVRSISWQCKSVDLKHAYHLSRNRRRHLAVRQFDPSEKSPR